MNRPGDQRGRDAFDAFFGDSSRSGGTPIDPEDERTQEIRREDEPPVVSTGELPEAWWYADQPSDHRAPAASSTWREHPVPVRDRYGPPSRPPRRGVSAVGLVALLVGGVLLGGIAVAGAMSLVSGGDDEPVAAPSTVTSSSTVTTTSEPPSTSSPDEPSSTSSSSTSSSSSSSTTIERAGQLPPGASQCAGPKQGTSSGSGTEATSCPFANAVRDAYLASGSQGQRVSLEVRSPVTRESYTMQCTGSSVTRCSGGNNAIVYLY